MRSEDRKKHDKFNRENQLVWDSKPLIRKIYMEFYRLINSERNTSFDEADLTPEIGAVPLEGHGVRNPPP